MRGRADLWSNEGYGFAASDPGAVLGRVLAIESIEPYDPKALRRTMRGERAELMKRDFATARIAADTGIPRGGGVRAWLSRASEAGCGPCGCGDRRGAPVRGAGRSRLRRTRTEAASAGTKVRSCAARAANEDMKRIRRIATFIAETAIGEDSERYRNPAVRWAVQQYRLLFYTARGLVEHGTLVRSAALTFYTLMSIVPVAAVIFAVVKGFGLTETLLDNLYGIFPQHPEVIEYLIGFAERALAHTQGGVVAVVALVTLFWAVIRAFASIESAFNNIWEVKTARSLTRQYSAYITIVVVVPLLWAATRALGLYVDAQLGLGSSAWSFVVSKCAVLVMTWLIFAVLYTAIPNTKVRFRSALTAGVVAGTLFMLFQWGYVYLQRWMTSYNAIYGSFAALPLFLIWMQTSWQILLFGGELSFTPTRTSPASPWSASRSASATTAGGAPPCSP